MGIVAGIGLGMVLGTIFSFLVFQGYLFSTGMAEIGVGQIGFSYFVSCFVASLFFAFTTKDKLMMTAYPIAVVAVGAIGLNQVVAEPITPGGEMFNIQASFAQMANLAAQLSFWGVPGVVTVAYAVMRWEQTRIVVEGV